MYNNLSAIQMGHIVGKDRKTIGRWTKNGMPRNKDGTYDAPACVAWLVEREKDSAVGDQAMSGGDSPALERYRLARAESAELDVRSKRGALISSEAVFQEWSERLALVRSMLTTWSAKMPPLLFNKTPDEMQSIIFEAVEYIWVAFAKNTKNTPSAFLDEIENVEEWIRLPEDKKREIISKVIAKVDRETENAG